ncbi:MAG: lytic transglycosylase domain-containing protein, partial [Myxococcota bacterium]
YGVAKRFARWLIDHPGSPAKGSVITEDGATVAGGGSSGTHQDQGRWLMAWIARRTQPGTSEAHEWLTDIGADSELFSGALYWQARFSLDRDDMLSAERLTATLMEHAPAHYYAHAATERLCRAGGTCLQVSRSYSGDRPGRRPDDLLGVVRIYDIGLRRSAFGLLKAIPSGGLLPVDRAYLAWLHRQASDLNRATWISRSVVAVPEFGSDPGVLSTAYPVAFADVVQREAERSGVPEALLLAVMREESGFNPKALSPRGARGLMQMIPRTARRMAVSAGVGGFALHRLYRPEVSIRLGAHYLRLLLKEFNGDLSAAIASYHAGEKTVARWKKDNEALRGRR